MKRLSTVYAVNWRFEMISASLTAQGRRSNETQTSFGDWRLTDGLKRISTVYHLGFQGSTGALKGFFLFLTSKESLHTKSFGAYRVAASSMHSFTFVKHTPLVSFFVMLLEKRGRSWPTWTVYLGKWSLPPSPSFVTWLFAKLPLASSGEFNFCFAKQQRRK